MRKNWITLIKVVLGLLIFGIFAYRVFNGTAGEHEGNLARWFTRLLRYI